MPLSAYPMSTSNQNSDACFGSGIVVPTMSKVIRKRLDLEASGIPFGALITPCQNIRSSLPVLRKPARCSSCNAYFNTFCQVHCETGDWTCVICRSCNSGLSLPRIENTQKPCSERKFVAIDYVTPNDVAADCGRHGTPLIFAIDATLDMSAMDQMKSNIFESLENLPSSAIVGLLTFGSCISIYNLASGTGVSCDVVEGNHSLERDTLHELAISLETYLAPLHVCMDKLRKTVRSLRPCILRPRDLHFRQLRCFGVGIEVSLALFENNLVGKAHECAGRILAVLAGPITLGPGKIAGDTDGMCTDQYLFAEEHAKKYIGALTSVAERANVVVDILAAGSISINVPLFGYLTQRTGGSLLLHKTFGSTFVQNMSGILQRAVNCKGTLDIYTSPQLAVGQVIGPASSIRNDVLPTREVEFNGSGSQRLSRNACEMNNVQPGQGFGVFFVLLQDLDLHCIHIQVTISWRTMEGYYIQRVVTCQLEVTASIQEFMSSVAPTAAAVLLSKRTILQALKEGATGKQINAQRLRAGTGARLKEIGSFFGKKRETSRGFFTGTTYVYELPHELKPLAHMMYHLVRGPMLGIRVGHPDERALLQTLFLKAGFDESFLLIAPKLYIMDNDTNFEPCPPTWSAMKSDALLVLDHGTQILVWLGSKTAMSIQGVYLGFISSLIMGRFPVPDICVLEEGSCEARTIGLYLMPDDDTALPQSSGSMHGSNSNVIHCTGEPSLAEWCRHYYVCVK